MDLHKPRKRFGQNFLIDSSVVAQIIQAISPQTNEHVVEIGPGKGVLTRQILGKVACFDAIEIDRDLVAALKVMFVDEPASYLHSADALVFDFASLHHGSNDENKDQPLLRIIGNLPYNITTPLLFHLINYAAIIKDMHFMLQREVAERLVAKPGSKTYGRLSVMLQYYCDIEILFDVPPQAFVPSPQIYSSFVRLRPLPQPRIIAANIEMLENVVRAAFNQRRKTIYNSLRGLLETCEWQQLLKLGINSQFRPEQLTVENFVVICNIITNRMKDKEEA